MIEQYTNWWETLTLLQKIYWSLAVPFTLFFLLQMLMTLIGGGDMGDDLSTDAEINGDTGIPFQFLTLKNLVAFFSIFSWTGIACLDSGMSDGWSLVASSVAGLAMMLIMASIFYFLSKADESGNLKMSNAKGKLGEVYLTIASKRNSIGQIQIKVQGSLRTLEAITDDEADIKTGKVVKVNDVIDNNLLLVTANFS
jgi:membrane protein implicated in regulation of membrane protease activity